MASHRQWEVVTQPVFINKYGKKVVLTQKKIEEALDRKSIKKWAFILHSRDVITDEPQSDIMADGRTKGEKKKPHWHIVFRTNPAYPIEQISKWFGDISESQIEIARGKNAFLDKVRYLTHEDKKQQEKGKTLYLDDEIIANFDFRSELNEYEMKQILYGSADSKKQRQRVEVLRGEKTLAQCFQDDPSLYADDFVKLKQLRSEYLATQDPPLLRLNFYVYGAGGYGKSLLSRALARSLKPELSDVECFFTVGAKGVNFDSYDGQPVIIYDDCRAEDLLGRFTSRGNVYSIFDPFPTRQKQSIKYGNIALVNEINIINSPQPYDEFLEKLAGVFEVPAHLKEDENQAYRRFPFIIPVNEEDFDFMINKGFMFNTTQFKEYISYKNIRGSFAKVAHALGSTEQARLVERRLLQTPVEKVKEIEKEKKEKLVPEDYDISLFDDTGTLGTYSEIVDVKPREWRFDDDEIFA